MITKAFRTGFLIWVMTACATTGAQKESGSNAPGAGEQAPAASALTRQLNWVLSVFNEHKGQTTQADIVAHFHSSFLAQIPATQVIGIFQQLANQFGFMELKGVDAVYTPSPGAQTQIAHTSTKAGNVRIVLSIDVASGTINGLFVQPDTSPVGAVPQNLNEADRMLQAVSPDSEILIAEVKNGDCQPVHQLQSSQPKAIGSAFKLYVLLALVDQVREKKISWDDMIAIQDRWKSLPSGTMQYEKAGTKFSVEKFAEQMISISDNTATDHLLYTLGRERVQAAMVRARHHKPDLNVPFLSTREIFFLKFKESEADAWIKLDPVNREKYLKTKPASSPLATSEAEISAWTQPRNIKTIEWFASGEDICHAMAGFLKDEGKDKALFEKTLAILGKNPGLPFNRSLYPYVGFKGGSEPGVFSLNWLLQRADQRWFVVSLAANDREKPLNEKDLLGVATGILQQVAVIP